MNTRLIILRGNFEIDNKFVTSKQSQTQQVNTQTGFSDLKSDLPLESDKST